MNYSIDRILEAKKSASILINFKNIFSSKETTIIKASVISGLSFKNTELGLHYLITEYKGYLNIDKEGELKFIFPYGLEKKWNNKNVMLKMLDKSNYIINSSIKFLTRSWISILIIFYIIVFICFFIFLIFVNKNSNSKENDSSFSGYFLINSLIRLLFDSIYWTFHPFSPFYINMKNDDKKKISFYEKVNNFVFGPEKDKNNDEYEKKILISEIVSNEGIISAFDIMRITGYSRQEVGKIISELMLKYEGEVSVFKNSSIIYKFNKLNTKNIIEKDLIKNVRPIWERIEKIQPLTGNSKTTNMIISSLNIFNIFFSSIVIYNNITLKKINYILTLLFSGYVQILNYDNFNEIPILFGWIPLIFSSILFLFPISRFFLRKKKIKNIILSNGQKGFLRAVYENLNFSGVSEKSIIDEWRRYTNQNPTKKQIMTCVIKYGGELVINDTKTLRYKFNDLFYEMKALNRSKIKTGIPIKDSIIYSSIENN